MKLSIVRVETSDQGTFSKGTLENGMVFDFIELPWRDNASQISCMPAGDYPAKLVKSPHFGRMVYALQGVPGRAAVEMHPANYAGDVEKGYRSDLKGCMAPGLARGMLPNPATGIVQQVVLMSVSALDQIIRETDGEDLDITVSWADGVSPE